jgi:hypothetical protein
MLNGRGLRPRIGRFRELEPSTDSSISGSPNLLHYFVPGTLGLENLLAETGEVETDDSRIIRAAIAKATAA